jgi:hypothetical protein
MSSAPGSRAASQQGPPRGVTAGAPGGLGARCRGPRRPRPGGARARQRGAVLRHLSPGRVGLGGRQVLPDARATLSAAGAHGEPGGASWSSSRSCIPGRSACSTVRAMPAPSPTGAAGCAARENLLGLAMPPSSQGMEPPGNPGRFTEPADGFGAYADSESGGLEGWVASLMICPRPRSVNRPQQAAMRCSRGTGRVWCRTGGSIGPPLRIIGRAV